MTEPECGAPFCWVPSAYTNHSEDSAGILGASVRVSGRIVYVNLAHRFFRAEAVTPGGVIRESFKF